MPCQQSCQSGLAAAYVACYRYVHVFRCLLMQKYEIYQYSNVLPPMNSRMTEVGGMQSISSGVSGVM